MSSAIGNRPDERLNLLSGIQHDTAIVIKMVGTQHDLVVLEGTGAVHPEGGVSKRTGYRPEEAVVVVVAAI